MNRLPACAHLPPAREGLSWRHLHAQRDDPRGEAFYLACLEYAQALWQRALPARAILCLDRAMGADLTGSEPSVRRWPMPYEALAWMLESAPNDLFIGNPRVHFQHYADRMNEPRRDQRRWRAWACWAITRTARPEWPADPRHAVREPELDEIDRALLEHGLPGEAKKWRETLRGCRALASSAGPKTDAIR